MGNWIFAAAALAGALALLWLLLAPDASRPDRGSRGDASPGPAVEVSHRVRLDVPCYEERLPTLLALLVEVELVDRLRVTFPDADVARVTATVIAVDEAAAVAQAVGALARVGLAAVRCDAHREGPRERAVLYRTPDRT